MSMFHDFDETFRRISTNGRLPPWLSTILLILLSALCWAALIALILALHRSL